MSWERRLEQLSLDLTPSRPTSSQLTQLPGTTWEHIFDMPTPDHEEDDE